MTLPAEAIALLQPEPERHRLFGMTAAERNRRVARREGCRIAGERLPDTTQWLLVLPDGMLIDRGFVAALPEARAPVRLGRGADAAVWGPAGQVSAWLAEGGDAAALPAVPLPAGTLLDLREPGGRWRAERTLLRRTVKPADGPVSRRLNRPISRIFSHLFLRLGLSAIHASAVCLAIGLAAGWFAAQAGHWPLALAGFLFQAASMFDGVDGEMARVTLSESPRGAVIDSTVDNFTYLACLLGLAIGWAREGIDALSVALIAFVLVATPLLLGTVAVLLRRYAPDGSFVHFTLWLRAAAAQPHSPPAIRLVDRLFPVTRRDIFALVLMLVAFTGSRQLIAALVAFGVLLGSYVLVFHRKALLAAARAPAAPGPALAPARGTC